MWLVQEHSGLGIEYQVYLIYLKISITGSGSRNKCEEGARVA